MRLVHVHRDADGAGLVRDRARDRLADPPGRVGGKLIAAAVFELVGRAHQADVAFLDQVQQVQAAVDILLGDRDDQAEVGLDEVLLGPLGFELALTDDGHVWRRSASEAPACSSRVLISRLSSRMRVWLSALRTSSRFRLALELGDLFEQPSQSPWRTAATSATATASARIALDVSTRAR